MAFRASICDLVDFVIGVKSGERYTACLSIEQIFDAFTRVCIDDVACGDIEGEDALDLTRTGAIEAGTETSKA